VPTLRETPFSAAVDLADHAIRLQMMDAPW